MRRTIKITAPLGKGTASSLLAGDLVSITGTLITVRDRAHRFLLEAKVPTELKDMLRDALVYHCGPLVRAEGRNFSVLCAGPTTSARFEGYAKQLVRRYHIGAVMGKGGMHHLGIPYISAVGGAGALLAGRIKRVEAVYMLKEFGMAEAIWVFDVEDFPALVSADSRGESIHKKVLKKSTEKLYWGGKQWL